MKDGQGTKNHPTPGSSAWLERQTREDDHDVPDTAQLARIATGHDQLGTRTIVELLAQNGARYIRITRYIPAPNGRLILSRFIDTFAGAESTEADGVFSAVCRHLMLGRTEAHQ